MRYLVTISYDGSNFYGFQRLKSKRTVQEELEKVLTIINKSKVEIKGAGRTDKGVHAYGQRAHFDLDIDIPKDRLMKALNDSLPSDIRITNIDEVDNDFHARFNVKKKIYQYKINNGEYDPLMNNYYYQFNYDIDINKLKDASKILLGVHNFKNFVSGERDNYDAIIYNIDIKKEKEILTITFEGKSFYRYMVRNMVGAMLDVATEKNSLDELKEMLDNVEVAKQMSCAPAQGLYLMNIIY